MFKEIAGKIDDLERGIGRVVESCFKMPATPESLLIAVKRKLEEKKRVVLGAVVTPNLVDIVLPDSWWDPWACLLPKLKESLHNDLQRWLVESGFLSSDALQIHLDFGPLKNSDFLVDVDFVPSPETILADTPHLVRAVLVNTRSKDLLVLDEEQTIIGRGRDCQARIADISVSRAHARIFCMGDSTIVEDLNSTNGTRVNREKVTGKRVVNDGDCIVLGETEWRFGIGSFRG